MKIFPSLVFPFSGGWGWGGECEILWVTCTGNLGNLPLIILPALCEDSNSPFGDSTVCSTYAEAYASLSMAVILYDFSKL